MRNHSVSAFPTMMTAFLFNIRTSVPLDYFNQSKGTSTIALGRYKATKFPKKGTVFLNPGIYSLHAVDIFSIFTVYLRLRRTRRFWNWYGDAGGTKIRRNNRALLRFGRLRSQRHRSDRVRVNVFVGISKELDLMKLRPDLESRAFQAR